MNSLFSVSDLFSEDQKNYIKAIADFQSVSSKKSACIGKIRKENEILFEKCRKILEQHSQFLNVKNIIKAVFFNYRLRCCRGCGKQFDFLRSISRKQYCSSECGLKDPEKIKAGQQTFLKKFGVKSNLLIPQVNRKAFSEQAKQKALRKRIDTNMKRFGVPVTSQNSSVKLKMKQTNLRKYGTECPMNTEEHKLNALKANTWLKQQQREKKKQERLKLGWKTLNSWKDYVIPLFSENEYKGRRHLYKWKCSRCGFQFTSRISKSNHIKQFFDVPRCIKCYPHLKGTSNRQKQLKEFVKTYFPEIRENDRNIIKPYQLDIYIPSIKTAIEFNGIFYHQLGDNIGVPEGYHLMKTEACQKLGIRLIHIWEDQDSEQVKNFLNSVLLKKQIFSGEILKLSRDRYMKAEIPGYIFQQTVQPQVIIRNGFKVENCGYLIYRKCTEN